MSALTQKIRDEISLFSKRERLFIFFAMACGFFITGEYAIIRPVSNAVFLTAYGSKALPWAWIAVVPLSFLVVAFYNKYLPRLGCMRMFVLTAAFTGAMHLTCSIGLKHIPTLPFLLYLWKEVYIMLMFQQLWSVIHSTIRFKEARYLYGLFFAIGALGATCGSLLPGFLAVKMGSEWLLLATLPLYLILGLCYYSLLKYTEQGVGMRLHAREKQNTFETFFQGTKLILSSRHLLGILLLVVFMQLSASLVDFQFNTHLEQAINQKDLRTEYMGKILSIVHVSTMLLQLVGGFLCVRYLGVKRTHLFIPCLLCLNATIFQCIPLFGVISWSFICIKSCDFSLFTILKELLYNPLKPDEKFRAKSIIDVFAHRSSKALASLLILGMQILFGVGSLSLLNWSGIVLFCAWIVTAALLIKNPSENLAAERA
jgi:AAA family ATP:ADP antiporter